MRKFIVFLLLTFLLCSYCRRIIKEGDRHYKLDKNRSEIHLQIRRPEHDILCSTCYRLIPSYFKECYERKGDLWL